MVVYKSHKKAGQKNKCFFTANSTNKKLKVGPGGGDDHMAKVGGPVSVVKVCTYMLCVKMGYR